MKNTPSFAIAIALSLGCTASPPPSPAPSRAAASPSAHADVRAPVLASWIERDAPSLPNGTPDRYVLSARVAQPGNLGLPLQVSVALPAGATLARGPARWLVQPAAPGSMHETVLEVLASVPPADDLVLVVDAQGEHAGVHAEARYRFGRPEPAAPQPPLAPTSIVIGGHDYGRPVQMTP